LTPSGTSDIGSIEAPSRRALLVGSEGPGVSRPWLEAADLRVRIPMHAGIDSLNVATAAAIALYALA
jgi:tRNA G18 (ribose-2'-O)-methylase SpoU